MYAKTARSNGTARHVEESRGGIEYGIRKHEGNQIIDCNNATRMQAGM